MQILVLLVSVPLISIGIRSWILTAKSKEKKFIRFDDGVHRLTFSRIGYYSLYVVGGHAGMANNKVINSIFSISDLDSNNSVSVNVPMIKSSIKINGVVSGQLINFYVKKYSAYELQIHGLIKLPIKKSQLLSKRLFQNSIPGGNLELCVVHDSLIGDILRSAAFVFSGLALLLWSILGFS